MAAHETIPEDETLYLEAAFPIPQRGEENHNWFDGDANRSNGAIQAMLEPLFFIEDKNSADDANGGLLGWLAESAEFSDNNTVIEIELRDAAAWSDGTPFTAHDVVFSLNFPKGKTGMTAPHVQDVLGAIANSEALTDKRVRITLKKPDPLFLHRHFAAVDGTSYPIVPKHVWEGAVFPEDIAQLPLLGTGPYELVDLDPGHSVTWERLPWWGTDNGWKPRPVPHRLVWHQSGPLENRVPNLVRGRRDTTEPVYGDLSASVEAITYRGTDWISFPPGDEESTCGYSAYLNPPATLKPSDEKEMRKALLALIDRGRLERRVFAPTLAAADSFLPQNGLTNDVRDRLIGEEALLSSEPSIKDAYEAFEALSCAITPSSPDDLERAGGGNILCFDPSRDPPVRDVVTVPVHHVSEDLTAMAIARELASGYQSFGLVSPVKPHEGPAFIAALVSGTPGAFVHAFDCSETREPLLTLSRFLRPPKPIEGESAKALEQALAELLTTYDAERYADAYIAAAEAFTAVPLVALGETIPAATHFWEGWRNVPLDHGTWSQRTHLLWTNLKPPKSNF